tara:strand:+ start:136 stop:1029 length:894 start_codon:yes stop_codon:yes gene_type:complete
MTNGIIYIARNDIADPPNHYKIGKSTTADPEERMRELNAASVNYQGEYVCLGYVLVNDVDKCERKIHKLFSNHRINNRREFFNIDIRKIITRIRIDLEQEIINYHLPIEHNQNFSNKELFNLICDFKNFNFMELCKISFMNGLNAKFHGIPTSPLFYLLLVLGNKNRVIEKLRVDPNVNFYFDHYIYGNNKNISLGTKIQEEVIKTNMKEYFSRIPFEENLLYLGVVLCFVECAEKKNNILEKFIIENLHITFKQHPDFSETIENFKTSINKRQFLSWIDLEVLEPLFYNSHLRNLR